MFAWLQLAFFSFRLNLDRRSVIGVEPVQSLTGKGLLPFFCNGNYRLLMIGQRRIERLLLFSCDIRTTADVLSLRIAS